MWRPKMTMLAVAAIGLGSLTVAGAGLAVAAGHGSTIHGCVAKSNGDLRIVQSAGGCKATETSLSFNSTGPRGAQGAQGPQGPQGPAGPAGTGAAPTTFQDFGNVDAEGDLGSHNGVKAVTLTDVAFVGSLYTVTFDNSIVGCSVLAVAGEVAGSDTPMPGSPVIFPASGNNNQVFAGFFQTGSNGTQTAVATPFMITATCTNVVHVG